VKELRGTESTRKSIQKLKRGDKLAAMAKTQPATVPEEEASPTNTMDGENNGPSSLASNPGDSQPNGRAGHTRRPVCLAINHRGVQFLDIESDKKICEHEIRNIDCACQDADDLSHFAYITKDQQTQENYCHVFNVFKMVSFVCECFLFLI
jgi:Phosphotyrosine interaction domain (PTB/PID)